MAVICVLLWCGCPASLIFCCFVGRVKSHSGLGDWPHYIICAESLSYNCCAEAQAGVCCLESKCQWKCSLTGLCDISTEVSHSCYTNMIKKMLPFSLSPAFSYLLNNQMLFKILQKQLSFLRLLSTCLVTASVSWLPPRGCSESC
jgi:hypothetical protein